MQYLPMNQQMDDHFFAKSWDNPQQATLRQSYESLFQEIDRLMDGPEKSVSKRKLLESMDAGLRCLA